MQRTVVTGFILTYLYFTDLNKSVHNKTYHLYIISNARNSPITVTTVQHSDMSTITAPFHLIVFFNLTSILSFFKKGASMSLDSVFQVFFHDYLEYYN